MQKLDIYDKEMCKCRLVLPICQFKLILKFSIEFFLLSADLEMEISVLRNSTNNLKMQSQRLAEEHADFKVEADQRERDLRSHIEHLERKDYVISSLLVLMVQRTSFLQEQLERHERFEQCISDIDLCAELFMSRTSFISDLRRRSQAMKEKKN